VPDCYRHTDTFVVQSELVAEVVVERCTAGLEQPTVHRRWDRTERQLGQEPAVERKASELLVQHRLVVASSLAVGRMAPESSLVGRKPERLVERKALESLLVGRRPAELESVVVDRPAVAESEAGRPAGPAFVEEAGRLAVPAFVEARTEELERPDKFERAPPEPPEWKPGLVAVRRKPE
jgi:hypothetical protein